MKKANRRHGARRDRNEPEIIAALVAMGCTVAKIASDDGVPDLAVSHIGVTLLLEVKASDEAPLTDKQAAWWGRHWEGFRAIVWSIDMAVEAVNRALVMR